jgi:hypothetical protein
MPGLRRSLPLRHRQRSRSTRTHASAASRGPELIKLFDALCEGLAGLDSRVQWQAVQSCQPVLGEPVEAPIIPGTRRL